MERLYLGRVILSVALVLTLSSCTTDTNSEPASTTELALLVEELTDSEIRQIIIEQSIRELLRQLSMSIQQSFQWFTLWGTKCV